MMTAPDCLTYDMPLYRPPSEAHSLIIQVTLGCSWNRCSFCEMYTGKRFSVKHEQRIVAELDQAARINPLTRKIFIADGNAMSLSTRRLKTILVACRQRFPSLSRISCYALPQDIRSKSADDLSELRERGLHLLYVGIESGDREVLKRVNKGETPESTVEGLIMARQAGIKVSVMIISGLGGGELSEQHALNSAQVVNQIQPEYLSTLVLMFPYGFDHFKTRLKMNFEPLDTPGILREMELFLSATQLERSIFRSDHASNYLALKGILNRDKQHLLNQIAEVLERENSSRLRPDWLRAL